MRCGFCGASGVSVAHVQAHQGDQKKASGLRARKGRRRSKKKSRESSDEAKAAAPRVHDGANVAIDSGWRPGDSKRRDPRPSWEPPKRLARRKFTPEELADWRREHTEED